MRRIVIIGICLSVWAFWVSTVSAQVDDIAASQCADVSVLMQQNKTPYDFILGGGDLEGGTASGTINRDAYADFWSFQLGGNGSLSLTFNEVSGGALEFALFNAMYPLDEDYRPAEAGQSYTYNVKSGPFTLVVRRAHVSDPTAASYRLTVDGPTLQTFTNPQVLTGNGKANPSQPRRDVGIMTMNVTGIDYRFHPGSIGQINDQRRDGSQVYFPNENFTNQSTYTLYTGAWTKQIDLLGGDLAVNNDTDRIFFLENYVFQGRLDGNEGMLLLNNLSFPDGTKIDIRGENLYGVWIANECTGFKLKDGRSFVAATAPQNRELLVSGPLDVFVVEINALNRSDEIEQHNIIMSWTGVREGSEVSLLRSVLNLLLVGERELSLQSTDLALTSQPPGDSSPGLLDATLKDLGSQVVLDWTNMRVFRLADDVVNLEFLDAPRGKTTRPGAGIQLFEALNDVIHLVYQPQANVPGEERLLLPAEDSYLEIITPPGDPAFNGLSLPDQEGFSARSLNNLGGECYPVTNILPQANCAPNGTPNAANGNVWVAFTDLSAHAAWMDLALTRSYNSRGINWTGPFGQGWTTAYLLDYDVAYDEATSSRPVTSDENYRVALDVRYAPRGLITFISPTGSQHPFVLYDDGSGRPASFPEEYRALTMPGWVIRRDSVRSPWELRQDDGLLYQFDRAGRLLRYGYPLPGRMIEIAYPRTTLDGPGSLGAANPVFITDTSAGEPMRRLELYYNADHLIERSVMRDLTNGEPTSLAECDPAANCFETVYAYDNVEGVHHLRQVLYSDGQQADYTYNPAGRLTEQHDPYGPLAPQTIYAYDEITGDVIGVTLANAETSLVWRTLAYVESNHDRQVTITDDLGNVRTYTYTRLPDGLRRTRQDVWKDVNDATYVLVRETSPLNGLSPYDSVPQEYTWENGLLTQVNTHGAGSRVGDGRLAFDFNYTPTGKLYCISCDFDGLPELRVDLNNDPADTRVSAEAYRPDSITFTDGSALNYEYDERGFIKHMTDRTGAIYTYIWSATEPVLLEQKTRENDGVVWTYTYNAVGLPLTSTERHPGDSDETAYTVSYTWDGLGRLIGVSDPQIGAYTMTYGVPTESDDGSYIMEITLTDPVGAQTVRLYDSAGRLLESRLQDDTGFLRRETYAYDLLGRLTKEERWVTDNVEGARPLPVATTYTYVPQESIDVTGLVPEGGIVTIRGLRTEVVDASGTQRIYIYDALGRLRETFDETQRRSYYEYSTASSGRDYGLRIIQYEKLSGIATVNINTFRFDTRWQLIGLERGSEKWDLFYDEGTSTRVRGLNSSVGNRTVTLQEVAWDWQGGAFPRSVLITQAPIDLFSRYNVDATNKPGLAFNYDFLGRPLRLVDGAQIGYPVAYCPQPGGLLLTIYGQPEADSVNCDTTDYQAAIVTDMHNRLVEYRDAFGTRSFTYQADDGEWVVQAQLVDTEGQTLTWVMRYNAAGDLTAWLDETGVVYTYAYDQLGRLISVFVPDQPEKSFTFRYNTANRLTEISDGLGRGSLYNYDETERVISQLNSRTADAVSFAYTPTGQLATTVSRVGNATTFLYEDPTNPARPTTVIDPTGNQHRFLWDDVNNSLVYTNPLNEVTRYRFDGTGMLWRIDDPLIVIPDAVRDTYRSHEVHYDSDGRPTDWLFDVRPGTPPQQQFNIARDSLYTWSVSETQGKTNWSQNLTFAPSGELTQVGDVTFGYDPLARLQQIAVGEQVWDLAWTPDTAEVILSDPFGLKTLTQYDALYRAISDTVNDTSTTYTYTPDADAHEVTLDVNRPGVGQRRYVFSPGNANLGTPPTISLLAYGQSTRYIFNGDGLLVEIVSEICSDASIATRDECEDADIPFWTTRLLFEYDADQRPIRITDQAGSSRTFAYDDADNLLTYQTASGRTYQYAYDSAQRLTSLTSATGVKLLFGYDSRDNLLGICRTRIDFANDYKACAEQTNLASGFGLLESYEYNTLDRLIHRRFLSNGAVTDVPYEYGDDGRLEAIGDETFAYNPLELLGTRETGSATYEYNYHALNQLAEAGDLAFVYDDTGRVKGYTSGGQTYSLQLSEDNTYTVESRSGASLDYVLDPRGFLSSLNFDDQNIISLEYIYDEREPGINLFWNNNTIVADGINERKETQNQLFAGDVQFTVFYELTSSGLVQRQDITELPGRSEGYIVVQGYDNDERPLTMRVTDSVGLQVLYTQTITYNTAGLRTGEQLQYADGTRVIKTLTYRDNSQLESELVIIIRPLQVAAAALWLLPLFLLRRRRGRVLVAALLLGIVALPLIQAQTPQTEERYQFTYAYDEQGNLKQVDLVDPAQTCALYDYDNANRLAHVTRDETTVAYEYDAYDRVTRIADGTGETQLSYQGTTSRILSAQGADDTYYLQTANQPAFAALDASGTTTWLVTDGRERIYQTYQEGDDPRKDLWLFDPLGRILTLQPPAKGEAFDPCLLGGTRAVPETVRLQSDPKGIVWDAVSGVYFFNGRAYDGEVGRYLQRDPNGPDSLGNVYDAWTRQTVPVARQETPIYAEGLSVLRDAMTSIRVNDQLSADAVKARYLPSGIRTLSPVTTMLQESRQPFDRTVNGLANLPLWLQSNYSLPAPGLDAMGHFTISQAFAPGQGGGRTPFAEPYDRALPQWDALALNSVVPPLETFTMLAQAVTQPPTPGLNVYTAMAWMPQPTGLSDFLQQPAAPVAQDYTPEAVLNLLPRTLAAPEQAAYTLDAVDFLYSLPDRPVHEWVSEALNNALPTRPVLPPQTLAQWEKDWFTDSLFGLEALSQDIVPDMPFIPFYEWGDSADWLHILR